MKRILSFIAIAIVFSSCQENVKFNNPGFQGLKDDVFWRANDAIGSIDANGKLKIQAYTEYETLTLNTNSPLVGTYVLGTTNQNNSAEYMSNFNDVLSEYATIAVPGPTGTVSIVNGGSGYSSGTSIATTGGLGSGLTINIIGNASGVVSSVTVASRGSGYLAGDIVTITGGNVNCRVKINNVQNSNGEIVITEYDDVNKTVSGKFKFNAARTGVFGNPILNFQYGEFYKTPIFP
jgi:hypothetical protein